MAFLGTSNVGTPTEMHLVLAPHTLLVMQLLSSMYSKMGIIGQLTNGDYAVLGMAGNSTYAAGTAGYNTTDGTSIYPVTLATGFQSAAGKLYTQALILRNGAVGVELNGDGSIASFQDVAGLLRKPEQCGGVGGHLRADLRPDVYGRGATGYPPVC